MSWFGEALEGVREAFDFVSGANDVVVVRHPDGRIYSSPFSVQTNAITVNRKLSPVGYLEPTDCLR
ncbi:hypothetical protein T484DRAFT_1857070 [Baffinella frigidus]|nr:hypothetical protein T484DRAFT_1857070 [Cryptophyta sp. CCMP2293]